MLIWILILPSSAFQDIQNDNNNSLFFIINHPVIQNLRNERFINSHRPFLPDKLISKYVGHPAVIYTHTLPAAVWAAIIPIQLHPTIRKNYRTLHRVLGYLFLLCCTFMAIGVVIIHYHGLSFENYITSDGTTTTTTTTHDGSTHDDDDDDATATSHTNIITNTITNIITNIITKIVGKFVDLLIIWFLYTAIRAILYARNKQFILHQRYFIRHIASGIWVAIQRVFIMFTMPVLTKLYKHDILIHDNVDVDSSSIGVSVMFMKEHYFPFSGSVGIVISLLVGEYTVRLLDCVTSDGDKAKKVK